MAGVQGLFFGDFLLALQKKVTRLSGRVPTRSHAVKKKKVTRPPGRNLARSHAVKRKKNKHQSKHPKTAEYPQTPTAHASHASSRTPHTAAESESPSPGSATRPRRMHASPPASAHVPAPRTARTSKTASRRPRHVHR